MCGIFGFLSSPKHGASHAGEDFFALARDLASFAADPASTRVAEMTDSARAGLLKQLEAVQGASYAWTGRDAFLTALRDPALHSRLRDTVRSLEEWTSRLETLLNQGKLTRQSDWEILNRLIVGGKDVAWQIDKDVLGSFEPVLALSGVHGSPRPADGEALAHAWQLNLILTSMNRLEVRGRDSLGLAAYVRFPGTGALESFLDGPADGVAWRHELERRSRLAALTHGSLLRPRAQGPTLLAVFKVANEVGRMGDNVAFLRAAIASDRLFQAALRFPGVELQCLAHTRWASNGIISLANCHPVDGAMATRAAGPQEFRGELVGVLNGDVDNYQELLERYVRSKGCAIEDSITTDAKIIPVVVGHHYRETGDLHEAFRRAFDEFEGSMAIGIMSADRPGEFLFGQRGSGQGLFLGLKEGAVAIASEMYGLVELTPKYVKAEGERVEGGEVFHLRAAGNGVEIDLHDAKGTRRLPAERVRTAEITTRDINRGKQPHFFLKEIGESVESVRKTLRGKFEVSAAGKVRFHLGADVLVPKLLEALRSGRVRKVHVIGQGTAAVAAEGIAHLLERALRKAKPSFEVSAQKATELSGHHLREDMSDTLVIAVSQSGTTTDTNRTVDMARDRGAWVLGIVNRRNSDLVYKSHGVLYTSDGRDIEMSVASTKAFYAQNVAGQVLALALAAELGTLDDADLLEEVRVLEDLPAAMAKTLALDGEVADLATKFSLKRRHWALVGSGMGKIAANEIRIKLSELCYKSIAVDFLEDKKHIDLSSEPLVIVCANGLPPATVSDVVKEVAIFKAHKGIPLVIADEGETRFDPYAAGVVRVPRAAGMSYLLATVVGHLFGYHAAARFDSFAERLRGVRGEVVGALAPNGLLDPTQLSPALAEKVKDLDATCAGGQLNGGLEAGTATRLARAFEVLLGWMPVNVFARHHESVREGIVSSLSDAIGELSRPIDAIKHQAKTVTVGISRGEAPAAEGALLGAFKGFGLPLRDLAETHRAFLAALEALVASVDGITLYRVEGLDPLGRPCDGSTIRVLKKTGCAKAIASRSEDARPLSGTKWGVVKQGDLYVGVGKTDGRKILIAPLIGERPEGHLVLFHLDLVPRGRRDARLRALRAREGLLERIQIATTERNVPWDDALIDLVDNDSLFFSAPDAVAEEFVERASATAGRK